MPPLLPEYLRQPLQFHSIRVQESAQVVVQSVPTDWWALIAAGVFTLAGAAAGAWFGGRAAYKNTVKAQNDLIRRKKLEEALTIIISLEDRAKKLSHYALPGFFGKGEEVGPIVQKYLSDVESDKNSELITLLQLYCNELHFDSTQLSVHLAALHSFACTADILKKPPEPAFYESLKKAVEILGFLKKELINRLSL